MVQISQVGWLVLILQWKMVKFPGRYALVIVYTAARTQIKNVDLTSSTNFFPHLDVAHATVVQTDFEANAPHVIGGFINK